MKLLSNCPLCGITLRKETAFSSAQDTLKYPFCTRWKYTCSTNLHHRFICMSYDLDNDETSSMYIHLFNKYEIVFIMYQNILITTKNKSFTIPWFDVDFSNMKKFFNKINMYLTFQ